MSGVLEQLIGERYIEKAQGIYDGIEKIFLLDSYITGDWSSTRRREAADSFANELRESTIREIVHEALFSGQCEIVRRAHSADGAIYWVEYAGEEYSVFLDTPSTLAFLRAFYNG